VTGIAAVLLGTQVVAAVLIMIGVRRLGPRRDCCFGSPGGARAIVAGATLWVLADLGSSPAGTDLLSHLRPWPWVGQAAATVGFLAALICALVITPRSPIDD